MRRHALRTALAAVAVIGLALTPAGAQQGGKDPEIQKVIDAYTAAWASGDAKALTALHTSDAIRAGTDGVIVAGRAAIEQAFTQGFATVLKGTKLTVTRGGEATLSPDVRVGSGTWEITGGTPTPGTPSKGTYINTLVRQGGRWLIASSAAMGSPQ